MKTFFKKIWLRLRGRAYFNPKNGQRSFRDAKGRFIKVKK